MSEVYPFLFDVNFNFGEDGIMNTYQVGPEPNPPSPGDDFLLLDGSFFLLLDSTNFLLL